MKKDNSVNSINIFINMIYEKVYLKFTTLFRYHMHKKRLKRFRNNIIDGSPSFGMLWKMADFIKLAEVIFFYDNSTRNTEIGLYSSRNYSNGQNGFIVTSGDTKIIVKLFSDYRRVALDIERLKGEKHKTSMSFTNDSWDTTPTTYDEMLLEQVIKIINSSIIHLFDECYKLR